MPAELGTIGPAISMSVEPAQLSTIGATVVEADRSAKYDTEQPAVV